MLTEPREPHQPGGPWRPWCVSVTATSGRTTREGPAAAPPSPPRSLAALCRAVPPAWFSNIGHQLTGPPRRRPARRDLRVDPARAGRAGPTMRCDEEMAERIPGRRLVRLAASDVEATAGDCGVTARTTAARTVRESAHSHADSAKRRAPGGRRPERDSMSAVVRGGSARWAGGLDRPTRSAPGARLDRPICSSGSPQSADLLQPFASIRAPSAGRSSSNTGRPAPS